jgi:hydrogenase expression/formation protein HypC
MAYPGQIIDISDGVAVVEFSERRQRATLMLTPDASVGDWVIVAAGTVLEILEPADASDVRDMIDTLAAPPDDPPRRSDQA